MPDNYMTFAYRMGAGFSGDVTRMTPAAIIEPCATHQAGPPAFTGQAVTIDITSGGARPVAATTEPVYGIVVRGFPQQTPNASGYFGGQDFGSPVNPWGSAGQPISAVDVLRQGYMNVIVNGVTRKGGPVFVWVAASAGAHVRGGFEAVAGAAGETIALPSSCTYQGAADANGVTEIAFNVGM
jgi:hypothetical protein